MASSIRRRRSTLRRRSSPLCSPTLRRLLLPGRRRHRRPPSRKGNEPKGPLRGPSRSRCRLFMAVSLGELAVRFGCELRGDPETCVEHVATLLGADARSLAFLANPHYKPQLATTLAAAVVLDAASAKDCPVSALVCQNPYVTYARIAGVLHPKLQAPPGVHPSAIVAASARIDPTAHVGALCVVGERVLVGPRTVV